MVQCKIIKYHSKHAHEWFNCGFFSTTILDEEIKKQWKAIWKKDRKKAPRIKIEIEERQCTEYELLHEGGFLTGKGYLRA